MWHQNYFCTFLSVVLFIYLSPVSVLLCTFSHTYPVLLHLMLSIHFLFYFSAYPYLDKSLSLPFTHLLYVLWLSNIYGSFSAASSLSLSLSCPFLFLLVFILGAGCVSASCWECQQDVLCHHRPVEDQQHVPLQPCLFSAPLPKGSSDKEGDWMPHNSYSASIFIQHSMFFLNNLPLNWN